MPTSVSSIRSLSAVANYMLASRPNSSSSTAPDALACRSSSCCTALLAAAAAAAQVFRCEFCRHITHMLEDILPITLHVKQTGCKVTAIFGLRGGRATRCAKHKLSAFVDVKNRRCEYKDCERSPSYGPSGTKKPLTCKVHSEKDWILVTKRYCQQPHCCNLATFGVVGRQPLACADHKLSTHTNVVSKKCFFDGCLKLPTFGPKKTAIACRLHCQAGWKDVVSQMCRQTGCEIHASYGLVKGKALYCSKHRGPTMSTVVGKFCEQESCSVKVYFNYTHCANHDTTQKRQTRVRENQIANLLRDSASIPWTHWNREIEGGRICGKAYRPDFLYDLETHVLAVEVDEMQHSSYECDRGRMIEIWNACGGVPVTFVRYNPDGFKLAGRKSSADTATRHELLLREVEKALAGKQQHLLNIVKLFFDNDRDDFVQRSWIDVDDHRFTETSIDD